MENKPVEQLSLSRNKIFFKYATNNLKLRLALLAHICDRPVNILFLGRDAAERGKNQLFRLSHHFFLCLSVLLTVCLSALDLQGVQGKISMRRGPQPPGNGSVAGHNFTHIPCRLHNAVLTSVTFLRVLSSNYSSFPLSLRLPSTTTT